MNSILRYEIAGKTHVGRKRTNNEDNLFFRVERPTMMVVADGMGGHAKGVAEANRIVADGLGGPEGYLRYLYIDSLKESQSKNTQVIYVPTEAGLPILEANRIKK